MSDTVEVNSYQQYVPRPKTALQLQSPTGEVKNIVLSTLKVKVMTAEHSSAPLNFVDEGRGKRHRLQKWFKTTFKWCVKALSLCCLRQHKRSTYTEPSPTCRGPVLDSKPTLSTNERGNSFSVEFVPIQDPVYEPTKRTKKLADADDDYYDDDEDVDMTSARLTAEEVGWSDVKPMSASSPPREILKKFRVWSRDEHERYCEALRRYRYGSWKQIAAHVGSRTERQVLSHAQSIRSREKRAAERKKCHQTGTTSMSEAVAAVSPQKMRKLSPEELLLASMADPMTDPFPSSDSVGQFKTLSTSANHHSDDIMDTETETITPNFLPWDLSFELELCSNGEMISGDGEEALQRCKKRSKPNSDASINPDVLLSSSSLDILLEGVLSDEDLLELLEIPSPLSAVQSAR